jgi:hypothetical protein
MEQHQRLHVLHDEKLRIVGQQHASPLSPHIPCGERVVVIRQPKPCVYGHPYLGDDID